MSLLTELENPKSSTEFFFLIHPQALQQHLLFFFFNSAPKTPRASAVWVVRRVKQVKFLYSGNFKGKKIFRDFQEVGWLFPSSASRQVNKEEEIKNDPNSSVFSDVTADEILSQTAVAPWAEGGGAFISPPSWTPWRSAMQSTWGGKKVFSDLE